MSTYILCGVIVPQVIFVLKVIHTLRTPDIFYTIDPYTPIHNRTMSLHRLAFKLNRMPVNLFHLIFLVELALRPL